MHTCEECNKNITEGFTDMSGGPVICDDCFTDYMNKRFGPNQWRQVDDDGADGFYQYRESSHWYGTELYWTEWRIC